MNYDKEIEKLKKQYKALGEKAQKKLDKAIGKGAIPYKRMTKEYLKAEMELDEKINAQENKKRSEIFNKIEKLEEEKTKAAFIDIKISIQKDTIKMLKTRLKHQQGEVIEAKKKLGNPGFTKDYLNRMKANVNQTKKMIKDSEKMLNETKQTIKNLTK